MGAHCRLIDRVIISGSAQPMELYVIDVHYKLLRVEDKRVSQISGEGRLVGGWNLRQRFRCRQFLEVEKDEKWCDNFCASYWEENPDIRTMREPYTTEFKYVFSMGYQNYL